MSTAAVALAEAPWAAMRDESLTANERRRPNARLHIGTPSGRAACGSFFLDELLVFDPAEAPRSLRCQRPACRKHWPT
jgi:hypothetical protein